MYWIKTDRGDLCNLALATDIRLERPLGRETKYRVTAFFPGGEPGFTWLASFDTETAARDYHDRIAAGLMPACDMHVREQAEPSFVREDRNGTLHFDDAADAAYRASKSA